MSAPRPFACSRLYMSCGGPTVAEQLQPAWLLDPALTYSESCANVAHGAKFFYSNLLAACTAVRTTNTASRAVPLNLPATAARQNTKG